MKHDKKALIKVEHSLDYLGKEDWTCSDGGMCIYCSSGGYSYKGINNEDKSEVLKCLIKELTNELIEKGYKPENIKVEVSYMTKEEFDEWVVRRKEEKVRDLEYTEKEIVDLKNKFTKALKKKVELNKPKDYELIWKNSKFVEFVENPEKKEQDI